MSVANVGCAPEPVPPNRPFVPSKPSGENQPTRPRPSNAPVSPVATPSAPTAPEPVVDPVPDPDTTPEPVPVQPDLGGIGASCSPQTACLAPATRCFQDWPGGHCSKPCSRTCPDAPGQARTLCVADRSGTGGVCVAKADSSVWPGSGCRDGYQAVERERFMEPGVKAWVCIPAAWSSEWCENEYLNVADYVGPYVVPDETVDGHACSVAEPLQSSPLLFGVELYRDQSEANEYMLSSCALAQTLLRMAEVLASMDFTKVTYRTVYSCELDISGNDVSTHGRGLAIDLVSLHRGSTEYPFSNMRVPFDFQVQEDALRALNQHHVFTHLYTRFCDETRFPDFVHADIALGSNNQPEWVIDSAPFCSGF